MEGRKPQRPEARTSMTLCTKHFAWNRTDLRVSAGGQDRDPSFDHLATIRIETGPMGMQVYATAEECRVLAKAFSDAAGVIDALAAAKASDLEAA